MDDMRVAVADNNNRKFIDDLIKHWEKIGHEVKFERGASEWLAQWADVYYIDTWDNNLNYLYKLYHGDPDKCLPPGLAWNNNKKPKIIVRVLDWEVWCGFVRDQNIVDWVDEIIFIAPHIKEKVKGEVDLKGKGKLIVPGVNLDKFTLKKNKTNGFQIGMVLGDMWWYKNHMAGLDIFTQLYRKDNRWRLHIRGQHEPGDYNPVMFDYYLESRGIKDAVTLYSPQEDMNEWYERIDILLHPGMKEAFCYAVAEAMAKGIYTVVNNFYGSKDIWPYTYNTHQDAVDAVLLPHLMPGSTTLRSFIKKKYSNKKMFSEMDKLLA